jgi:ketosteroid isomerase-like protein
MRDDDPSDVLAVLAAAQARAEALTRADGPALEALLHPTFAWTTHTGQMFDRDAYVRRNTDGTTVWHRQHLGDPTVVVVGDTAVLRTTVTDEVAGENGATETFGMPMTQVWVREGAAWRCLAGHAGPRASGRIEA